MYRIIWNLSYEFSFSYLQKTFLIPSDKCKKKSLKSALANKKSYCLSDTRFFSMVSRPGSIRRFQRLDIQTYEQTLIEELLRFPTIISQLAIIRFVC